MSRHPFPDPSINTLWQYYPMNTELQQSIYLTSMGRHLREIKGDIEFLPEPERYIEVKNQTFREYNEARKKREPDKAEELDRQFEIFMNVAKNCESDEKYKMRILEGLKREKQKREQNERQEQETAQHNTALEQSLQDEHWKQENSWQDEMESNRFTL